jgi:hypothetical protein
VSTPRDWIDVPPPAPDDDRWETVPADALGACRGIVSGLLLMVAVGLIVVGVWLARGWG